ncbi:PadR family transcriptional regulator [Roseicella aquatilis]|uniref:PadR family transcriptional regulator n=1 Tax=Roseicella aquatilis TaxID=2527868 RepID=A0A4R4DXH1_9PROT|nr:PadR family transcriptional regulator [Roseicella aquatilis]TCZ65550.1 PadR family transcriptional regulator [Roseicella aquatilis]
MHHRHSHHDHHHAGCGRRFARGEQGLGLHPFGHGRHGRGGGRGGLGRFFAQGDLRLVILHLIAEKPRHGYELIKDIEERAGGAYSPSPGVIYPTLTLLEELGYVTAEAGEGGGKKLHAITEAGHAFLAVNRAAVEALLARMEEAGRLHGGGPAPQVLRAMENLKLALRLRLARGPLSEEQANAVAAALDAAATGVERS